MTEKDYVKEQIALLKLILTGVFGTIFAIVLYIVIVVLTMLSVFTFYLTKIVRKSLDELKRLR